MKKIVLRSVKPDLLEKKLTEEQMDELCGGMKCPYCHRDFEPDMAGESEYACRGIQNGIDTYKEIMAISAYEAQRKAYAEGMTEVFECVPGPGYNTAPGY